MSFWTYVQGMMIVEPMGRTQPEKEYILKTVLSHLPEVSGSEGPMQIYINQVQGFDSSSNHDEFFNKSNLGEGRYGRMFRRQDEYILTLNGYLRDRQFSETYKEFMKWLHRFSKRVMVKDCIVRITDFEKDKVITNENDYFGNLYEWTDNWCDYLMWEYPKDKAGQLIGGKPQSTRKLIWHDVEEKPWDFDCKFVVPVKVKLKNQEKIQSAKYYVHSNIYRIKDKDVTKDVVEWQFE